MKYIKVTNQKSVKSIHPCKSVIQTSYDIVKAHGGDFKAATKEGQGSAFVVSLPVV
jgi:sensor histidine kinase regulating citrate/malate metabolism